MSSTRPGPKMGFDSSIHAGLRGGPIRRGVPACFTNSHPISTPASSPLAMKEPPKMAVRPSRRLALDETPTNDAISALYDFIADRLPPGDKGKLDELVKALVNTCSGTSVIASDIKRGAPGAADRKGVAGRIPGFNRFKIA